MPGDLTEEQGAALAIELRDWPKEHQIAYIKYLYRLADDEPVYDSLVLMFMDLGVDRATAHARADATMKIVAH